MAKLKYLVIHCTATKAGREVTAAEIRRWHTSPPPVGRGWKQVGYTDLFHLDGSVERLVRNNEDDNVDSWEITNGAAGFNSVSRHASMPEAWQPTARPRRTPARRRRKKPSENTCWTSTSDTRK